MYYCIHKLIGFSFLISKIRHIETLNFGGAENYNVIYTDFHKMQYGIKVRIVYNRLEN